MARMPRLVLPNYPHHVTQRGNRRMKTFFHDEDYRYYLELVSWYKSAVGVDIWGYCLMPNHVHFVAVPSQQDSLANLFREVHRRYSRYINFREKWKGHLWQERFHSFVMDESYLMATIRYVELNPVKAKLCENPEDWVWSSTRAHLQAVDDNVVSVSPMLDRVSDWMDYLGADTRDEEMNAIKRSTSSGRPAGSDTFIQKIEVLTGQSLAKNKPGPKPRIK